MTTGFCCGSSRSSGESSTFSNKQTNKQTLQDRFTRKIQSPHLNHLSPSCYRQELPRELHHMLTRASHHFESLANEKTRYFKAIHLVGGLHKLVPDFSQQPE